MQCSIWYLVSISIYRPFYLFTMPFSFKLSFSGFKHTILLFVFCIVYLSLSFTFLFPGLYKKNQYTMIFCFPVLDYFAFHPSVSHHPSNKIKKYQDLFLAFFVTKKYLGMKFPSVILWYCLIQFSKVSSALWPSAFLSFTMLCMLCSFVLPFGNCVSSFTFYGFT